MRSGIYDQFEKLSAEQRVAFLTRLTNDPVARRHVSVSFGQRWLWFLDRVGISADVYSSPLVYRFDGALDLAALRGAVELMCQRHEVLRSRFVDFAGEPLVLISNAQPPFEVVDLRKVAVGERVAAGERALLDEVRRPFDLAGASLVRCKAVIVDDDDYLVVLNAHHIVTDGWSVGVMHRELGEIYRALLAGCPPVLPDLPLQYIDYAAWQNELVQGDLLEAELAYWRRALDSAPTVLDLPHDRARPERQSFRGGSVPGRLPSAVVDRLGSLGRAHGATPFMVFYALYAALLCRCSGQDDLLIGVPDAGRTRAEFKDMIGIFVNTFVLRADLAGDPSFAELLKRVRHTALDAYPHATLPFEKVVEQMGGERKLDRNPLFQALFTYDTFNEDRLELGGVTGRFIEHENVSGKFDLALFVRRRDDGGAEITMQFSTDLFDRSTAAGMLRNLARIAEAVADDPDLAISALPPADGPAVSHRRPAPKATVPPRGGRLRVRHQEPRDDTERRLHRVWTVILGRSDFGVHDDFFSLGGSSMLALRLVFHTRQAFAVPLEPATVFEAPTIAGMAERVRGFDGTGIADAPVARAAGGNGELLPLSVAQRRLWFLDQMGLGVGVYNAPMLFRLRRELNLAALRGAVVELRQRHEVLCSRFVDVAGEPWVSLSTEPAPFQVVTLREVDPAERRATCDELVARETERPFDLSRESPLRCLVVTVAPDDHVVVLNMHHIVTDGWSEGIILRELMTSYQAWCAGEPVEWSPLSLQYADYASWQRATFASERFERNLGFWRDALRGAPEILDLPPDRPRPARQSFRGDSVSVRLPSTVTTPLEVLGRSHNATPFMVYHAIWVALLSRYSGQTDFLVGVPSSGRSRPEFADVVGMFVNTIVLRADVSSDPSFGELLRRVRDNALQSYAHADVPFERLVEDLSVDRKLDHNPLFQVYFSFDALGDRHLVPDEAGVEPVDMPRTTVKFDLDLGMGELPDGSVEASLAYASDLFDEATARRMMRHFGWIAEAVAVDPALSIGDLPLLDDGERTALTAAARPALESTAVAVHEFVERQAEVTPDAIAVRCGQRSLTYRQLDESANRLAWCLRRRGVGSEIPVGLFLSRDERMLVTVLGILKAGGAFVPLDPSLPTGRLDFLLSDSAVPLVVTDSHHRRRLADYGGQVVSLDEEIDAIGDCPADRPDGLAGAGNMAYILYTSGSTGIPKGVVVEHRNVVSLVEYYRDVLDPAQVAAVLGASPLGFDASILEIFATLPLGGTLVLVDSVFDLHSLPDGETVTLIQTVPSIMGELLKNGPLPSSLTTVCLGGEPVIGALVEAVYSAGSVEQIYNIYGPTEYTVDATWSAVARGTARPAIGRPLPGTRCYVLDPRGNLVPHGVRGELYLAGPGLARGYLHRQELTRARFVPDPFSPVAGDRMYRTGDQVRLRADGELEFLGRTDRQVKVRGMRIELGEIEQVLAEQPQVAQAVVVVHPGTAEQSPLAAYLVTAGEWDEPRVRAALRARLPEYMIPVSYVVLDALPLTSHGKLDAAALPEPVFPARAVPAPAGTKREKLLADVWRQVLKTDQVGVYDNFFDAGGTSFMLISLRARIDELLGRHLPIATLYEFPTIASLAEHLDLDQNGGSDVADSGAEPDRRAERLRLGRARLERRRRVGR